MMNCKKLNRLLFSFLNDSPTPFHAVASIEAILKNNGFLELHEDQSWSPQTGQPYYLKRDNGSLVAFNLGRHDPLNSGFRMVGSHCDSPCLKVKPNPDIFENTYHKLGVEIYGGVLLASWFDRELSIAGRVCLQTEQSTLRTKLIKLNHPVAVIPSLAIHFDRNANTEKSIDAQKDITPVIGINCSENNKVRFIDHLLCQIRKEDIDVGNSEISGFDLFLYDNRTPSYAGLNNEFILGSRLDNLLSCFVAAMTTASADNNNNFMFVCNNHEEVGSNSFSGAQGNLALSVLERLLPEADIRHKVIAKSFFISIDNAHAIHPNSPEKSEPGHHIYLNHGPVLKINAAQRYTTTSSSNAVFKMLCKEANVPTQEFVMRNDMACGSTIGPVTSAKIGVQTVDVGSASLSMHSIRELTGSKDPYLMYKVINAFFQRKEIPGITE